MSVLDWIVFWILYVLAIGFTTLACPLMVYGVWASTFGADDETPRPIYWLSLLGMLAGCALFVATGIQAAVELWP